MTKRTIRLAPRVSSPLKAAVDIPATAFLSGGRDARPPRNAPFQGEKAVPGNAHLLMGVVRKRLPMESANGAIYIAFAKRNQPENRS